MPLLFMCLLLRRVTGATPLHLSVPMEGHQGHSFSCVFSEDGSPRPCFMFSVPQDGFHSSPLAHISCYRGRSPGMLPFMFLVPGESRLNSSSSFPKGFSDTTHICLAAGTPTVFWFSFCLLFLQEPSSQVLSWVWASGTWYFGEWYCENFEV